MKTYVALFLAAISLPTAAVAGVCAFEFGLVWSIRQATGVGVLVCSAILLLALIMFLWGVPAMSKRLRLQTIEPRM